MNFLKKLDESFEEVIMGIFLIGMSLILLFQILMRMTGNSLTWAEEVARYMYVWSVFLSVACTMRKGNILKVDLILQLLPAGVRRALETVLDLINVVLFGYLSYHAFFLVQSVLKSNQKSPALEIPMYLVYWIIPVGFSLACLRSMQRVYFDVTGKKVETEIDPSAEV